MYASTLGLLLHTLEACVVALLCFALIGLEFQTPQLFKTARIGQWPWNEAVGEHEGIVIFL